MTIKIQSFVKIFLKFNFFFLEIEFNNLNDGRMKVNRRQGLRVYRVTTIDLLKTSVINISCFSWSMNSLVGLPTSNGLNEISLW